MSPWTKCVLSTHPFDLMLIISCTLSAFLKSISNPTKPILSQTVSPSVQHDVAVDKVRTINVQHTPFIFWGVFQILKRYGSQLFHPMYNAMLLWTKCQLSTHPFYILKLCISCTLLTFFRSISNPKNIFITAVSSDVRRDVAMTRNRMRVAIESGKGWKC